MFKAECFFNSIFFNQFFMFYSCKGSYYKVFIFFFFILKFFKKRKLSVFYFFSKMIADHFIAINYKSKILFKLKKRAKKFKKKKKIKKYFTRAYKMFLTRTPKKKLYKTLRKFCMNLWISKNKNFIILMYSSILNFFCYLKKRTRLRAWYLHLKLFIFDSWKISVSKKKKRLGSKPKSRFKPNPAFVRSYKRYKKRDKNRKKKKYKSFIASQLRISNPVFLRFKFQ